MAGESQQLQQVRNASAYDASEIGKKYSCSQKDPLHRKIVRYREILKNPPLTWPCSCSFAMEHLFISKRWQWFPFPLFAFLTNQDRLIRCLSAWKKPGNPIIQQYKSKFTDLVTAFLEKDNEDLEYSGVSQYHTLKIWVLLQNMLKQRKKSN